MVGKASFQKTPIDLTNKNLISSKVLFGVSRQNSSGIANVGGVIGSGQGQSITPDGTGLLKTSGGSMIGPIAYYPKVKNLSYPGGIGHLDVSSSGAYTSMVLLGAVGSLQWYWIDGDSFDGQILKVLIPGSTTIHIHNGDGVTTGNIFTKTGSTVDVTGICVLTFTFSLSQNGWVMEAGQGDIYANTTLSNLTSPTSINQYLLPSSDGLINIGSDALRFAEINGEVIANVNTCIFGPNVGVGSTRWIQHSGGLVYNVLTGEAHSFQVNNVEYFDVRGGNCNVTGIFTVSGTSNLNGNINTDTDITRSIGGTSTRFIINGQRYLGFKKSAGTPSVTDLPDGYFMVMKDTRQASGVGIKLWYNDANNLVSVALS